jgi:hydrogenase 3 maturation protease
MREVLSGTAEGLTVILTVGNPLRRDDGAGPYIAGKARKSAAVRMIDAGERPEDFMEKVIAMEPASIVFIDAAEFGGSAGEIRVLPEHIIPDTGLSTHAFSLRFLAALLRENTGARITFIGIQSGDAGFGEGLSPGVQRACDEIAAQIGLCAGDRRT